MRLLPFDYAVRNLGRSPTRLVLSVLGSTLVVLLVLAAGAFAWIAKAFREEDAGVRAQRDVVPATGD